MLSNRCIYIVLICTLGVLVDGQQLQWILLSEGTSIDTPTPRSDAALGFDQNYLILYGGRGQNGRPLQDSYSFNTQTGQWDPIHFQTPPAARYGMASANAINSGLYIFGGFGTQSSSQPYNPYTAYAAGQQDVNYNYATPPNFVQNPILMNNPDFVNNPNYNPMSGTGLNVKRDNDEDDGRIDHQYYPLQDAWFLNYMTKTWQQTQTTQHPRGFGSATTSPYGSGSPKVIYSMGKSRDWIYSTVESIGEGIPGLSQTGATQSAIVMYDMPSYNPTYPHARYGHSTALLTDNQLLLYGGCLSGYGKGGPCPSTDTWLLHIDRGHWERLRECPTTKTGAVMAALPSSSTCASVDASSGAASMAVNGGSEPIVAVLWSGQEKNPSSIRTEPSPRDEIAVFNLERKEWTLKRASPYYMDGSYPMQREGAAFVPGCFQGSPGIFVFGGRGTADNRMLSDLWFLKATPQDALNSPGTRGCIYPFSYYHLHGIFQFFAYGIVFPIGYFVGRFVSKSNIQQRIHVFLQAFGLILAIIGFSFGIHSVRAPAVVHFRHAHAIIGIITTILTLAQAVIGILGLFIIKKRTSENEFSKLSTNRGTEKLIQTMPKSEAAWRRIHGIHGFLIIILGLVNICLGVFLAVLPLAVWIVWYVYFGILILALLIAELLTLLRRFTQFNRGPKKIKAKREDPKRNSQLSIKYVEEPLPSTSMPPARRSGGRFSSLDVSLQENQMNRRPANGIIGDDRAPLIPTSIPPRQPRSGDVSSPARLPQYQGPLEKEYPIGSRTRNRSETSGELGYYMDYSPERGDSILRAAS